jgi:hypothetical protein
MISGDTIITLGKPPRRDFTKKESSIVGKKELNKQNLIEKRHFKKNKTDEE